MITPITAPTIWSFLPRYNVSYFGLVSPKVHRRLRRSHLNLMPIVLPHPLRIHLHKLVVEQEINRMAVHQGLTAARHSAFDDRGQAIRDSINDCCFRPKNFTIFDQVSFGTLFHTEWNGKYILGFERLQWLKQRSQYITRASPSNCRWSVAILYKYSGSCFLTGSRLFVILFPTTIGEAKGFVVAIAICFSIYISGSILSERQMCQWKSTI